jgi:hypothetical protein
MLVLYLYSMEKQIGKSNFRILLHYTVVVRLTYSKLSPLEIRTKPLGLNTDIKEDLCKNMSLFTLKY